MKYYKRLIESINNEDFNSVNNILFLITQEDYSIEYVEELLRFMEENPNIDYGMPGPIVHYMEKFYSNGYEDLLYKSVMRKPTIHTLWMLNRVLNSPTLKEREKYILALKQVAENINESNMIRDEAKSYLQYQVSK